MSDVLKKHYKAIASRKKKADVETLYGIIDRLLMRIEELETELAQK